MYTIVHFEESFLKSIVESFVESFPSWSNDKAGLYLMQSYMSSPEFCYVCIGGTNEVLAGIFCKVAPYNQGFSLVIESLQVLKNHRVEGVGSALLQSVIEKAKEKNITHISMLAPTHNDFPLSWYRALGFEESGWVELVANLNELEIKI